MLEAKAKDQGHKAQVLSKKKKKRSSQKFFKRSPRKNAFQKIFQPLHKISTFQNIVLSSSRGQANFRGLEASRPRPRTSKSVLEAKDVLEDSTSGECCVLFVPRSFVIKKKHNSWGISLAYKCWGLQMRSKSLKQHCPALCIKKTNKIGRTSNCGWFRVRQLFLVYRKVDATVNATLQDPAWTGEPRKAKWPFHITQRVGTLSPHKRPSWRVPISLLLWPARWAVSLFSPPQKIIIITENLKLKIIDIPQFGQN